MTYRGHIRNGAVVLESGAALPEGTEVLVQPVEAPASAGNGQGNASIWQKLLELSGTAQGLPADLPERHDEYRRKRARP